MEIKNLLYWEDLELQGEAIRGGAGIGRTLSTDVIATGQDISAGLGYQNLNQAIRDEAITGPVPFKNQGSLVSLAAHEL